MGLFIASNHFLVFAFAIAPTKHSSSSSVPSSGSSQPFPLSGQLGPSFGSCPSSSLSCPGSGSPAPAAVGSGARPPPFYPACSGVLLECLAGASFVFRTGSALLSVTIVGATDL